ncbi:MAG: carboxypeptidase regulatory-like domain-containing protein [Acidobacteriota bacterium]|nr:carboxypeptidase regulatory-like domain-containing protein [Acidobacteriota bacterium]
MQLIRRTFPIALACVSGLLALPQNVAAQDAGTPATTVTEIALPQAAQNQPSQSPATISGTVTDKSGDLVPNATVVLTDLYGTHQTVTADANGGYSFPSLKSGIAYRIAINADGFVPWTSEPIVLNPGQYYILKEEGLAIAGGETSVTVTSATPAEIAVEQVQVEEQQRIMGFIPNFYVVYDKNPVPLSSKLKFKLAFRAATDPITFIGAGALAGMNQAGDTPNYPQGSIGYAERYGAAYGDGVIDLFIGGAILPSLLHQDPRYYFQGTGTKRSRMLHAMTAPFICKGDNGKSQFNYSSLGGDLISSAISNVYYPPSNRGLSFVFTSFALETGERVVSTMVQEFVLRRLTPSAKRQDM